MHTPSDRAASLLLVKLQSVVSPLDLARCLQELTNEAADPVVQQPDPDHLGSDVAVVIQLVDQLLPRPQDVGSSLAGPDRLQGGLGLLLGTARPQLLLPDALVELLHALLAVGTADGAPLGDQLRSRAMPDYERQFLCLHDARRIAVRVQAMMQLLHHRLLSRDI